MSSNRQRSRSGIWLAQRKRNVEPRRWLRLDDSGARESSTGCGVRTASSGWSGRSSQRRWPGSLGRRTRSLRRVPVRERSPGRRYPIATMCKLLGVSSSDYYAWVRQRAESDIALISEIRAPCGVVLGRRAWLFAGSDRGGERAATVYSLIVTAKLNDVDPRAWHANVLAHCRSPGLQSARTVALALVEPDRGPQPGCMTATERPTSIGGM